MNLHSANNKFWETNNDFVAPEGGGGGGSTGIMWVNCNFDAELGKVTLDKTFGEIMNASKEDLICKTLIEYTIPGKDPEAPDTYSSTVSILTPVHQTDTFNGEIINDYYAIHDSSNNLTFTTDSMDGYPYCELGN